ncbi:MAG TPA: hypothetical protein VG098_04355, partial [Nitrososphaera sp.]|nr:hypothetical protein [Nitrososphaera sp.]
PFVAWLTRYTLQTLQQIVDDRIPFLKEQINPHNKAEENKTFQLQIDAIRSIDDFDIEKVEFIIKEKKELLKNSKDVQETDRLLAKLEALEWLQVQVVVFTLDNRETIRD